jgi:4-carboxymuconolactone decarboxylase
VTEPTTTQRFEALAVDGLVGDQRTVAQRILKFSLNGLNGPFNMMLRSPEAAEILLALGDYIRFRTTIPPRLAEFAVLIHARLWPDQYEWDVHVNRAAHLGLSAAIIDDVKFGRRPLSMNPDESTIFDYCVELLKTHTVRNETFLAVSNLLGERGLTDLTIMLGQYATISMILSVSQDGSVRSSIPIIADPFS